MFKINENDSFGVEISKSFGQAVVGSAVATAGMLVGMAIIGWIIDRTHVRIVGKDKKIVPIKENEE